MKTIRRDTTLDLSFPSFNFLGFFSASRKLSAQNMFAIVVASIPPSPKRNLPWKMKGLGFQCTVA